MYTVPVVIPYYPDELLYSWLYRLAIKNGHNNLIEYFKKSIYSYCPNVAQYDIKNIGNILMALPRYEDGHFVEDFLNMSLYSFYSLFMSSEQQTNYLNSVFRTYRHDSHLGNNYNTNLIKNLYFCPECKTYELETYGEFYYHRSHQLPSVKVCTIHHCLLHRFTGKKGHEFDVDTPSVEVALKGDILTEFQYAAFVKELLENNLDYNYEEIISVIENKLKEYDCSTIQQYKDLLQSSVYSPLLSTRSYKNVNKITMHTIADATEIDFVIMLLTLYQHPSNLPRKIKTPPKQLLKIIEDEGYVMMSHYRENIIQLGHIVCQTSFITSSSSLIQGWRCPYCDWDKTDQEVVEQLVNHVCDGTYELISTFESWNKPMKFIHRQCGTQFETKLRSLIFEKRRCLCKYNYTFEMIRKNIEGSGEYKLLDYKPTMQIVKVKAISCGHEFEINYYKFLKHPYCRVCTPRTIDTREFFIDEMRNLVGDEYELIGDYYPGKKGKKIMLLHKFCNQTKEMHAWNFLNGQRCPHCTKQMRLPVFKQFVKEKSNGRYECIDEVISSDMMVTILDTNTKLAKKMNKNLVRQELMRPTISTKLPV